MTYRFLSLMFLLFLVPSTAGAVEVYDKCMDSLSNKIQNVTVEQFDAGCKCVVSETDKVKISEFNKDTLLDAIEVCFDDVFEQSIGLGILNECMKHPKAQSSAVFRNVCRCVAKSYTEELMGYGIKTWLDPKRKDQVMSAAKNVATNKCKR